MTIFTSMFVHGGWLHILGNMLYLWLFGRGVETALGLRLNDYKDSTGRVFYNADAAPVLPSSISGRVSAVLGLSSLVHYVPLVQRAPAGRG